MFEGPRYVSHLFRYPVEDELRGAVLTEGERFATLARGDRDEDEEVERRLALSAAPGGPDVPVVTTRLKHVMEKRNGAWKVVAAQNTFESGPPPAR